MMARSSRINHASVIRTGTTGTTWLEFGITLSISWRRDSGVARSASRCTKANE
jgi:hypothetical protein